MNRLFAQISITAADQTGRPTTFIVSLLIVFAWLATGPI
jgi:low affinity Fe/Cu permease